MLSPAIQEALNKQINHEFYSSYFYLSVSAYFESLNLQGFSHWMRLQSQEEREHGMRLLDHLHDRNGHATFEAIAQPPVEFQSPVEAFQQALQHEDACNADYQSVLRVGAAREGLRNTGRITVVHFRASRRGKASPSDTGSAENAWRSGDSLVPVGQGIRRTQERPLNVKSVSF